MNEKENVDSQNCYFTESEIQDLLERTQMELGPDLTHNERISYLDGYLNCLLETGRISDEQYDNLRPMYVDSQRQ